MTLLPNGVADDQLKDQTEYAVIAGAGPEGMASAKFTKTADRGDCCADNTSRRRRQYEAKAGDAGGFS